MHSNICYTIMTTCYVIIFFVSQRQLAPAGQRAHLGAIPGPVPGFCSLTKLRVRT